jgi:hypothetical protein
VNVNRLPDLPMAEPMGPAEASELKLSIINESKLLENRTYKLQTHTNSLIAASLVDWLVHTNRSADRIAAVHVGRQLRHIGLRSCDGTPPHPSASSIRTIITYHLGVN